MAEELELAEAARSLGDPQSYAGQWWPFHDRPWQYSGQALGFLPPARPGSDLLPLFDAGNIEADPALRQARISLHLDLLHFSELPGRGERLLLLGFQGENRPRDRVTPVHLSRTCEVRETMPIALRGDPVFVGLSVGGNGLSFSFCAVQIIKKEDKALLDRLNGEVLYRGLPLSPRPHPALDLYSHLSYGLTKYMAERNALLQRFSAGLDFGDFRTGVRLAEGTYFAVQVPATGETESWHWADWAFDPESGRLVRVADPRSPTRFNYAVFRIQRHER